MEVKGTGVVVVPEYVRRKHGEGACARWLGSLPESSRVLLQGTIRLSDWFPVKEAYLVPTEAACRLFFRNENKGARELGRFSADFALGGVYRMFLRLPSIKFFIGRSANMLSTYFRPGDCQEVSMEDGRAVVHITKLPESHRLIENRIAGWLERALEIHGCREAAVDITQSLAGGDRVTEIVMAWTAQGEKAHRKGT